MASQLLRTQLHLRPTLSRLQFPSRVSQSSRHHTTSSRPLKQIPKSFFLCRSAREPTRPRLSNLICRRTYTNGPRDGYDPFATYRTARATIWTIVGLNTLLFGAWQYANATQNRALLNQLAQNFTLSWPNLDAGRYWTILTSAFSHIGLTHIVFNMLALHAFGSIISVLGVGGTQLTILFVGSAVVGSAAWLYQRSYSGTRLGRAESALGASGMVMGAGAAATCLMPFAPMKFILIPVSFPLWFLTLVYVGVDTYYLHAADSTVGHAAHLGGSIFGAAYYLASLRRFGGVWYMFGRGIRR